MSLEKGGRADKCGNRYENRFFAGLLVDLIQERFSSIEVEPLGDEGRGVEFITTTVDGEREYYQCKASNGMQDHWRPGDLDVYSVFQIAMSHVQRGSNCKYHFVSPLPYDELDSLCNRARENSSIDDFITYQLTNTKLRHWWNKINSHFDENDQLTYSLLSKCYFDLVPDSLEYTRKTEAIIELLFFKEAVQTPQAILILLGEFANDDERWGRPINAKEVISWLESKGYHQRPVIHDERILTRIRTLNQLYCASYSPIRSTVFHRSETEQLLYHIHTGMSVLLLGKAGSGKSGCIHELLDSLEREKIIYLALRLDQLQPTQFADHYGKNVLGLPCSPVVSIYNLAGGQPCVLIFDQLDSLRWANKSSSIALEVCKEMIRQANHINQFQGGQISCIFVVRSFDYETDPTIHNLFENEKEGGRQWEKITVDLLSPENVERIIGSSYKSLTPRLQSLLQTPSNLYIWDRLTAEAKPLISSFQQLMRKWWEQVKKNCIEVGFSSDKIDACRDNIISIMQKRAALSLPATAFHDEYEIINALASQGVLQITSNSISFVHQSFFDFFSVEQYIDRIYTGDQHLPDIFNNPDKQTPDIRYQFLMLLQTLADEDLSTFSVEAESVLNASCIRYYFQCCVFEVISQLETQTDALWSLISRYLSNENWHEYLVNMVLNGHPGFIRTLAAQEPDYAWQTEEGCLLLHSIAQKQPKLVLSIIRRHGIDKFAEQDLYRLVCSMSPNPPGEALVILQKLLSKNGGLLQHGFELYQAIEQESPCALPMLNALVSLEQQQRSYIHLPDEKKLKTFAEQWSNEIITELLPSVIQAATTNDGITHYMSDIWSPRHYHHTVEQDLVYIIESALCWQAREQPDEFLSYLKLGTNSFVERSLQGHAIENLPVDYADQALEWILSDFDNNAFDDFSREKTKLSCCVRILERFSPYCSINIFQHMEHFIYYWHPPVDRMRSILQYRIETSRVEGNGYYSISFWGDLQSVLLPALDPSRTSNYAKELIHVLTRKFPKGTSLYDLSQNGMAQFISSPIDPHVDHLSDKSWLQLIADMSREPPKTGRMDWENGTEASPEMFARSLSRAAGQDPVRFANLALLFPDGTAEPFIDAMLTGLQSPDVPLDLTCDILRRFCQNPSRNVAISYAQVIEHRSQEDWPTDILNGLIDIAAHHSDPLPNELPICTIDEEVANCDNLRQSSINCARGYALFAISDVLWNHPELFETFREITASAVDDENPAVLFSAMRCIVPWYNTDRDFAKKLFNRLLRRDIRTLAANDAWQLMSRIYWDSPAYYRRKLLSAARSKITDLSKCALEMITVLAANDPQLSNSLLRFPLTTAQSQVVCHQAVQAFYIASYHAKSQVILEHLIDICDDLPQLDQLFYQKLIDPQRDKEFLLKLVSRGNMRHMAYYFINYLKEYDGDILAYTDVIHEFVKALFLPGTTYYSFDELIICIARLFHQGKEDLQIRRACLDMWDIIYHNRPWAIKPFAELIDQI